MSLITSVQTSAYNAVAPKVRNVYRRNFNKTECKGSNNSKRTEKQKKDFPWGKVVLGALITAAIVEGVLRFDPIKRQNMRKYKEIFTDPDRNKRNFLMISARDEVIITEVADGNENARKLFSTLQCDGEGILEYMQAERKVERTKQNFITGRYETLRKKKTTVAQEQEKFFAHLRRLKEKSIALYEKHIKPIIKY